MQLPRKVLISGKTYDLKRNPRKGEGWGRGNIRTRTIEIGSKHRNCEQAFETLVHEVTELALIENSCRFNRDTNDEFFYMVHHHELGKLTDDIAEAIKPMLKDWDVKRKRANSKRRRRQRA